MFAIDSPAQSTAALIRTLPLCVLFCAVQRYMREESSDVRELFALMERMLEYDPDERIGLSESLEQPFFAVLPEALLLHRRNPPPAAVSSSPTSAAAGSGSKASAHNLQSTLQTIVAGGGVSHNQNAPLLALTPSTAGSALSSMSTSAASTPTTGLVYGSLGTRV